MNKIVPILGCVLAVAGCSQGGAGTGQMVNGGGVANVSQASRRATPEQNTASLYSSKPVNIGGSQTQAGFTQQVQSAAGAALGTGTGGTASGASTTQPVSITPHSVTLTPGSVTIPVPQVPQIPVK